MYSPTNLDHDGNMPESGTDAEAPNSQEQVVYDGRESPSPADDRPNVGETEDDTANEGVSALHEFIKGMKADDEEADGEVERLREMLRGRHEAYVNAQGLEGVSPLHIAAERGFEKVLMVLIEAKANIAIQDDDSRQPLHYACSEGKPNIAKLLLDNGADIEAQGLSEQTPLQGACRKGHSEVVELLLERGANVNSFDDEEYTPLIYAAEWGQSRVVEILLRKDKSNIDHAMRRGDGWTALQTASYFGREETVAILRREEAGMGVRDDVGCTPLMLATDRKQVGVMRHLLHKWREHEDLHLNAQDKEQDAALTLAAGSGFAEGVRLLMDHGADCNIRNKFSMTPIIIASRCRNRDVVLALLQPKSRADINAQDQEGKTALHHAASWGHVEVVQLLLKRHADASILDAKGRQALHLACLQGNVAIVKILLSVTAVQQLETCDQDGMTPLHIACKAGDEDVKHMPIEELGPENLTNLEGDLSDFISGRHHAVFRLLLDCGADPDAKTKKGETVLHLALQSGEEEKVLYLVEAMGLNDEKVPLCSTLKQVDFNKVNSDFDALLKWAASEFSRHSIAKSLIQKRHIRSAPSSPKSKDGSAIEWANWADLPEVLWLIIANSPWDKKTMAIIKSLETPKTPPRPSQQKASEQDQRGYHAGPQIEERLTVQDVIRDPPLGLLCNMHADSQDFRLPTVDKKMYSNLDMLSLVEAAVFQFYKGKFRFGSIRRDRNVQEVIYSKGPQTITEAMMKRVKNHIHDLEPSFTWVHLPSTNVSLSTYKLLERRSDTEMPQMVWMNVRFSLCFHHLNYSTIIVTKLKGLALFLFCLSPLFFADNLQDLLQTIMKNEGYSASQFRQVKAFLKASWVQVPDKTSESRIMRPRFAIKDHVPEAGNEPSQVGIELQSSKTKKDEVRKEEKGRDKKSKSTDRPFDKEKERGEGAPRDEMIREDGTQTVRSTAASAIYVSDDCF